MTVETAFQNIADAIRERAGTAGIITPAAMPQAILDIPGGMEGILFGEAPPTTEEGVDGDYYYVRNNKSFLLDSNFNSNANTGTGGYEIIATLNGFVTALSGYIRASTSSVVLRIGTTSNILASVTIDNPPVGEWFSEELEVPIEITAGTHYIIQIVSSTGTLRYSIEPFTTNGCTFVQGRYGSFPGYTESGTAYSVKATFSGGLYLISGQYYKISGAWQQLA